MTSQGEYLHTTPAELVDTVTEAIRRANDLIRTGPGPRGFADAGDVEAIVGGLGELTAQLPQLLSRLAGALVAADTHGTLAGPTGAARQVASGLHAASDVARGLAEQLGTTQAAMGGIGGTLPRVDERTAPHLDYVAADDDQASLPEARQRAAGWWITCPECDWRAGPFGWHEGTAALEGHRHEPG
ncbi:MAG TPA: hypothetical protein VFA46_12780 [Actinomycetes bacterium]|jgi:hypothetical protein|nr:hypothetical protein [Actinomycetes bacterium]